MYEKLSLLINYYCKKNGVVFADIIRQSEFIPDQDTLFFAVCKGNLLCFVISVYFPLWGLIGPLVMRKTAVTLRVYPSGKIWTLLRSTPKIPWCTYFASCSHRVCGRLRNQCSLALSSTDVSTKDLNLQKTCQCVTSLENPKLFFVSYLFGAG